MSGLLRFNPITLAVRHALRSAPTPRRPALCWQAYRMSGGRCAANGTGAGRHSGVITLTNGQRYAMTYTYDYNSGRWHADESSTFRLTNEARRIRLSDLWKGKPA